MENNESSNFNLGEFWEVICGCFILSFFIVAANTTLVGENTIILTGVLGILFTVNYSLYWFAVNKKKSKKILWVIGLVFSVIFIKMRTAPDPLSVLMPGQLLLSIILIIYTSSIWFINTPTIADKPNKNNTTQDHQSQKNIVNNKKHDNEEKALKDQLARLEQVVDSLDDKLKKTQEYNQILLNDIYYLKENRVNVYELNKELSEDFPELVELIQLALDEQYKLIKHHFELKHQQ